MADFGKCRPSVGSFAGRVHKSNLGWGISIFPLFHVHERNFIYRCFDTFAFRTGPTEGLKCIISYYVPSLYIPIQGVLKQCSFKQRDFKLALSCPNSSTQCGFCWKFAIFCKISTILVILIRIQMCYYNNRSLHQICREVAILEHTS